MFYMIRLDENYYVTHSDSIGWHSTKNISEASNLDKYWIGELLERFEEDLKDDGCISLDGLTFKKYKILQFGIIKEFSYEEYINQFV